MKCFIIMPFLKTFDAIFEAIKDIAPKAILDSKLECFWLKDVHAAGRITDDIIYGLSEATFCIADVTGNNPNVMWETGYAMALGKPTILVGQQIDSLPFDLKAHRVLVYTPDRLSDFKERIKRAITDTLARYEIKSSESEARDVRKTMTKKTISVTGSMYTNEAAVNRRVRDALMAYLSKSTSWFVGSFGTVDLSVVRFLLRHEQNVCAVGYNRYDCAPELQQMVKADKLQFIDASVEALPKGLTGPTQREVFFCTKSDLIILFWDAQSTGTKEMVRYYQEQGVSTLLVFI